MERLQTSRERTGGSGRAPQKETFDSDNFMCSCPPGTKAGSHAKFDDDAANGLGVHRADLPGVAINAREISIDLQCLSTNIPYLVDS